MALIEVFHVVAASHTILPDEAPDIPQGALVGISNGGNVHLNQGTQFALGIAGDSRSDGITSFSPESGAALSRNPKTSLTGALVIGSFGSQRRFTQGRVADNFNETTASGKMTVYHSGGEFWTDQYETIHSNGTTIADYVPMSPLYCSDASETPGSGDVEANNGGRFTDQSSVINQFVGFVLAGPTNYPSGVPGTETGFTQLPEGGNSLTWGTMLHVKLVL